MLDTKSLAGVLIQNLVKVDTETNMKTILVVLALTLTGCAQPPRWLANMYDNNDPCQSKGVANYQYPSFCGASAGTSYVTRDYRTGNYLTVTKAQK